MRHRNFFAALVILAAAAPALASHGWSTYHWARPCSTCAVSLTVYDSTVNVTYVNWPNELYAAIFGDASNPNTDTRRGWDDSISLTLSISASDNDATTRSNCAFVTGAIRVCNYTYGTGVQWHGIANLSIVGSHIAAATARMNDSFLDSSSYTNPWRRHAISQETGHDFGLDHTSTDGSSQNTSMDYYFNSSGSDWTSTGPNDHDFEQLLTQTHWGSKTFLPAERLAEKADPIPDHFDHPWQWGDPVGYDYAGRPNLFRLDLGVDADGDEHAIVTHVIWDEHARPSLTAPERSFDMRRR